ERRQFDWITDLLVKLGREDDAYDACALIVPEWDDDAPEATAVPEVPQAPDAEPDGWGSGGLFDLPEIEDVHAAHAVDVDAELAALPVVTLRHDLVPAELDPARFFRRMLEIMLDNSSVLQHEAARARRAAH
ncbi:MAG TPA: hypothetical protein PLF91_09540, partial [Mycolicibacterium fallax]|nr:hypothetical protein [Mycolicibacterium fallax]